MINLLSSKQPPFCEDHISCRDYPDQPAGNATKNDESQTTVEGLTQSDVTLLPGPPDLVVPRKDLLYFFRAELMPGDMENVVIVPLERTDAHVVIVSGCIYNPLRPRRAVSARRVKWDGRV